MRIARCIEPGVVYHVISRFVDRGWFFSADEERDKYLFLFGRAVQHSDWTSLSYCLMSNHIHHGLLAGAAPMSAIFKKAHSPFANWMNERHHRIGPIFADRPASWATRPENEARLIAYIHNNPVRAGVVTRARDSSWSSHRAFINAEAAPPWLDVETARRRSGIEGSEFDRWVDGVHDLGETDTLAGIHRAARKRGALELGTPTAAPVVVPLVARRFARILPDPREVIDVVAELLRIEPKQFRSRSTKQSAVAARCIAVHSGVALGITASEMGTSLGISRQAASQIMSKSLSEVERAIVVLVGQRLTELTPSPGKPANL
jgi:hypothetical protein